MHIFWEAFDSTDTNAMRLGIFFFFRSAAKEENEQWRKMGGLRDSQSEGGGICIKLNCHLVVSLTLIH